MTDFTSKTIVITGASRGIGAAAALHFATLNANVVLIARSGDQIGALADQINAQGGKARALTCDVGNRASVEAAFATVKSHFGPVDILVNNAGVIDPIGDMATVDPDAWANVLDINTKAVFYTTRTVLPDMVENGGGTVINISSGAAYGALEGWSAYCTSKAAALMLTKATDKEYRARGIRAIGLSPGTVATDMQVKIKASGINPVSQLDPNVHIPTEWVARAIACLCGPEGDAYLGVDFKLREDAARRAVGLPLADA